MVTTRSQVAAGKGGRRAKNVSDANTQKKKMKKKVTEKRTKDNKVDDPEDCGATLSKSRNLFFVRKFSLFCGATRKHVSMA
jgi:hypothetical protein